MNIKTLSFLILFSLNSLWNIQANTIAKQSLWGPFVGYENMRYLTEKGNTFKHGPYQFKSQILFDSIRNTYQQLEVNGHFFKDSKDKIWEIIHQEYSPIITGFKDHKIISTTNGIQRKTIQRYDKGVPHGNWEIIKTTILDGKELKDYKITGSIHFVKGIPQGPFYFDGAVEGNSLFIQGNCNKNGYLDGQLRLEYSKDSLLLKEERIYKNGILLSLIQLNKISADTLLSLDYECTASQNVGNTILPTNTPSTNYNFGLMFDNGYKEDDPKLSMQLEGNERMGAVFQLFSNYTNIQYESEVIFPSTNRFRYQYPYQYDSLFKEISHQSDALISKINHQLTVPRLLLIKEKSDTLAFYFAYLNQTYKLLQSVSSLANDFLEGEFEYRNMCNYYPDGLSFLLSIEPLVFTIGNRTKEIPYPTIELSSYCEHFPQQLDSFLHFHTAYFHSISNFASKELQYIKENDKLDSLEAVIVSGRTKLIETYTDLLSSEYPPLLTEKNIRKSNSSSLDIVYARMGEKKVNELSEAYIESSEFETKWQIAKRLIEVIYTLLDIRDSIVFIQQMPAKLDSAFTRYIPNPFDNRMAESKFKQNIYHKGALVLFDYYNIKLKQTESPLECKEIIKEIYRLYHRLLELSEDDSEDIERLNRRLKKESVPERIKRLLNL